MRCNLVGVFRKVCVWLIEGYSQLLKFIITFNIFKENYLTLNKRRNSHTFVNKKKYYFYFLYEEKKKKNIFYVTYIKEFVFGWYKSSFV